MKDDPALLWIREQLECFDRLTQEKKRGRDSNSLTLQNRVSLCLHLNQAVRDVEHNWGESVREGTIPYDITEAEKIRLLFVAWLKGAERVYQDITRAKAKGRLLALGERLKDAIGFCYQARLDLRELNDAFDQIARGEVIRLTEENHGVRRRRAG